MKSTFLSKKLVFVLALVSASVFWISCDDNGEDPVDLDPPTVENVTLNDQSEDIQVNPGDVMHFDADFADDNRLGQVKIDIHDNFDGHSHGRLMATPFTYQKIIELIGKTQNVHEDINIPEDAATGPYHFNLQFFDEVGNEGELMVMEFEIVDEAEQPSIAVTAPDLSSEVEVAPGGSFALTGSASDPDGLEELHIQIMHEEEHDHDHDHEDGRLMDDDHGSEEALWEKEWELEGAMEAAFDEMVTIPADAEHGHYVLRIMAKDMNSNVKVLKGELHVE